jgi:mannose-6-phosphate isomerase-like protein (cupin superfamily)
MRTLFLMVGLTVMAPPAEAQTPPAPVPYASPADVAAAVARAKAAATLSAEVVVALPPLRVAAEYRSKPTPASVHEKNIELINVLSGSGTLIMGGTLKDEKRRDAANLTGTGIDGGRSYELLTGSYIFIPAGTPHYFASIGKDGLVTTTIYIPAGQ